MEGKSPKTEAQRQEALNQWKCSAEEKEQELRGILAADHTLSDGAIEEIIEKGKERGKRDD